MQRRWTTSIRHAVSFYRLSSSLFPSCGDRSVLERRMYLCYMQPARRASRFRRYHPGVAGLAEKPAPSGRASLRASKLLERKQFRATGEVFHKANTVLQPCCI
jgi:hypothetical protein